MEALLHFRNLYFEAFANCRPIFLVILLKAYSVFCGLLITMALYAFLYRAVTGFDF